MHAHTVCVCSIYSVCFCLSVCVCTHSLSPHSFSISVPFQLFSPLPLSLLHTLSLSFTHTHTQHLSPREFVYTALFFLLLVSSVAQWGSVVFAKPRLLLGRLLHRQQAVCSSPHWPSICPCHNSTHTHTHTHTHTKTNTLSYNHCPLLTHSQPPHLLPSQSHTQYFSFAHPWSAWAADLVSLPSHTHTHTHTHTHYNFLFSLSQSLTHTAGIKQWPASLGSWAAFHCCKLQAKERER